MAEQQDMANRMSTPEAQHHLRGLTDISLSNLRAGRITRYVMHEALAREKELPDTYRIYPDVQTNICPLRLADILNDMLEVARVLPESE